MPSSVIPDNIVDWIGAAEDAIVHRLEPVKKIGFSVMSTTDDLANLAAPHPFGLVFVNYEGSDFEDVKGLGFVQQKEILEFRVSIESLNLRTKRNVYYLIQVIKILLTGFTPTVNHGKLLMKPGRSIKFEGASPKTNFWEFSLTFLTDSFATEDPDDNDRGVLVDSLLKQMVFLSPQSGGDTSSVDPPDTNILIPYREEHFKW